MGWTYTSMPEKVTDYMQEQYSGNLLACSVVKRRTAYAAYMDSTGQVLGIVWLLSFVPKSSYPFGYKDMDEHCGPNECECPIKILNMLTPLDKRDKYALGWRTDCWSNIMNKRRKQFNDIDKDTKYLIKDIENIGEKLYVKTALEAHLRRRGHSQEAIFKKCAEIWGMKML